jgi:hypothetical protein
MISCKREDVFNGLDPYMVELGDTQVARIQHLRSVYNVILEQVERFENSIQDCHRHMLVGRNDGHALLPMSKEMGRLKKDLIRIDAEITQIYHQAKSQVKTSSKTTSNWLDV